VVVAVEKRFPPSHLSKTSSRPTIRYKATTKKPLPVGDRVRITETRPAQAAPSVGAVRRGAQPHGATEVTPDSAGNYLNVAEYSGAKAFQCIRVLGTNRR